MPCADGGRFVTIRDVIACFYLTINYLSPTVNCILFYIKRAFEFFKRKANIRKAGISQQQS
jgi:hypothetical protein